MCTKYGEKGGTGGGTWSSRCTAQQTRRTACGMAVTIGTSIQYRAFGRKQLLPARPSHPFSVPDDSPAHRNDYIPRDSVVDVCFVCTTGVALCTAPAFHVVTKTEMDDVGVERHVCDRSTCALLPRLSAYSSAE